MLHVYCMLMYLPNCIVCSSPLFYSENLKLEISFLNLVIAVRGNTCKKGCNLIKLNNLVYQNYTNRFFGWNNSRMILLQEKPTNYDDFFGRILAWTQVQSIPQWPGYKYCLDSIIMTKDHLLKFPVSRYLSSFTPIILPV